LPVLTVCALLDMPEDIWPEIKRLSVDSLLIESRDPDKRQISRSTHEGLMTHAREMTEDRKKDPRDPDQDMVTAIVTSRVAEKPVDDETSAGMIRLSISAGHNSTTSGFGNALLYLAEHTETQQQLRNHPEALAVAVDEFLRYETPVQAMPRYLTKDVVMNGRTIPQGERLDLVFGSANRDEQVFNNADQCILDRKPDRHFAFGHGLHKCIGAHLARMEIRVGLEQILSKTRSFHVAGEVKRPPYHRIGVDSLPVQIDC
jgi:cytochrome P450